MSVWRIKDVNGKTREQAETAAQRDGVPLGAWLERAIMRRVDVPKKPQPASTAATGAENKPSDATPATPLTADASERIAPTSGKRRKTKGTARKRGSPVAEPPTPSGSSLAAASDITDSAPVLVTAIEPAEPPTTVADPGIPATANVAEPDRAIQVLLADEPSEPPAVVTTQDEPPGVAAVDPVDSASPAPAPTARRSISLLPILTIVGLVAIVAIGGYFLFLHDESDAPIVAQNPPIAGKVADANKPPPAAPPVPTPAPSQTPPPAAATPSPMPSGGSDVASAPPKPGLPPGIPAPTPGVQPSLLIPVPGSNDTPPVVLAPPAADFPNRPGPVVVQQASIPNLITRAEAGDVDAQVELGKRYMQGTGTAKDPKQALHWLEKAAEAGNGTAQFNVAVMYETGLGTVADPVKAVGWYRKAVSQTLPVSTAMHNLALLYANGAPGIPADPVQARILMIQAAELDLPQSQYSAALMYYQGVGGPVDKAAALSWLAIAARTNDARLVQAALQLDAEVTPAERAKAQQLAKQHDKIIADNKVRLRAIAAGNAPPGSASTPPADSALDRAAIIEIQKLLTGLKLLTGPADGATGPKTEQAIRDYQAMAGLPVDGKATAELLTSLRDVAGAVTPK